MWAGTFALGADLQPFGLGVVRPLLDDAVAVASDPKVVLVVDEAAMDLRLRARDVEGIDDFAVGVVLDYRRRRDRRQRLHRRRAGALGINQVAAIYREHVVLRIDARSSDFAGDPRQRLTGRGAEPWRSSKLAGHG